MRAAALWIERLSRALHRLALWGAVAGVLVMLGAALWQVFARYILSQPPAWTEELARYSMVWAGLLGASCAFRLNTDPSLFPDMRKRRGATGHALAVIRALGALALVTPILWFSIFGANMNPAKGYLARLAGRQAATMDVLMIVFGLAVPVAFALILIHLLAQLAVHFGPANHKDKP